MRLVWSMKHHWVRKSRSDQVQPDQQRVGQARAGKPHWRRRAASVGVLFMLLLAGVLGSGGPVAHADPSSCYVRQLGYTKRDLTGLDGIKGYQEGFLYARYRSFDGTYCGAMYAKEHVHLNPGSAWGYMDAILYDCNGKIRSMSPAGSANGGGDTGKDYYASTIDVNLTCGSATIRFWLNGDIFWLSTGTHWA